MRTVFLATLLTWMALTASAQTVFYEGVRQDVIVDVRTPAEFSLGHVKGAVNIPLDSLTGDNDAMKRLDKNSHILIYCRSGRRSAIAQKFLAQRGFRQVRDGGGMTSLAPKLKACNNLHC